MRTAPAQLSSIGFDRLYGLELVELGDGQARGRVVVRDELKDARGRVHGGVYAAIAESLAVAATARMLESEGRIVTPISLQASFLRPIADGAVHGAATARHRGRTTWVWEVQLLDDSEQLCGLSRVTVAVSDGSGPA